MYQAAPGATSLRGPLPATTRDGEVVKEARKAEEVQLPWRN